MLLSRQAVEEVVAVVQPRDFYIPKHEIIFDAILELLRRGDVADVITVTDELAKTGSLQRAGGAEYLHTIVGATVTSANAGYHADIVAEKAVLRRLVEAGTRIVQMGYASEGRVEDILSNAAAEVDAAAGAHAAEVRMMTDTILDTIAIVDSDDVQTTATPWRALNNLVGGLRPGALYVVGARPGVGKTVIGLQLAVEMANHGTVAFCSLEMPEKELHVRAMSAGASVPLKELGLGKGISDEAWRRISAWRAQTQLRIAFDDRSGTSVFDVRTFARAVHRKHPLSAIVVDYLQLMTDPRDIPRWEKVGEMSRHLKILARDLNVPVIAMSQLNRGSETRADKMPQLSDLRESGSIEQDADVVVLLHRDMSGKVDASDELVMFVAKNRHGDVGQAKVRWQGEYVRALDYGARDPFALGGQGELWQESA
jgi:replicative DNA helicase